LFDHRIASAIPASQIGEKAGGDGAMQGDCSMPFRTIQHRARRAHGMVEMTDAGRDLGDETASGFS
jgi:hypothetical protein